MNVGGVLERSGGWARQRPRLLIAIGLFVVCTALIGVSQRDQGIARDETVYMHHGSKYADWWLGLLTFEGGHLTEEDITKHFGGDKPWANNREHPPLMKTLFGLSERLFHDKLGWFSQTSSYRLPTVVVSSLLIVLAFLFVSRLWGMKEGLFAAVFCFLLPRWFFHAGLATFDAPVATFWFAAMVSYYRSWTTRWGFVLFGVCVGLCLATKHNAIMLPAVFVPHAAWMLWTRRGIEKDEPAWRRWALPQLVGLMVIGPLVAVLLWPWLWFDTFAHVRDWIGFHLNHVHYNFEYLGKNWNTPPFPWHVPLVTTILVIPITTLVAALIGAAELIVRRVRSSRDRNSDLAPDLLLVLSAGVAIGPFFLGSTPIFGGAKHWMAAISIVAIFAGIGLVAAIRRALAFLGEWSPRCKQAAVRNTVWSLLVALPLLGAAAETSKSHPYALSHYNALAGGAPGGADLGMNRQFWGVSARGVLDYLNQFAPKKGEPPHPVYSHNASPAWGIYRAEGYLKPGLPDAGHEGVGVRRSHIAIVIHQLHFNRHDYMIWEAYGTVQPAWVLTLDGVPLVSVYLSKKIAK
jgi:hypothetical protein